MRRCRGFDLASARWLISGSGRDVLPPWHLREKFLIGLPFRRFFTGVALAASLVAASPTRELDASMLALRAADARVAAIGHRLAVAGRDLCADRQWLPGFALHDLSQYRGQYRDSAIRQFGLGAEPALLAVVPGSAAEQAGLRADDLLIAVDGAPVPALPAAERSFDRMAALLDLVEAGFADGRAELDIVRSGEARRLEVAAEPGCATRFQLVTSGRMNALADGRYVQVTTALTNYAVDDAELAAVLAHELAHNALRHRVRLDEAGVARGLLGHFGRHARLIRETEIEADRLSPYLLDRAGFDPEAAVRFWDRFGRSGFGFASTRHPNWRRRIASIREEIVSIRRARSAGTVPMPGFAAAGGGGGR